MDPARIRPAAAATLNSFLRSSRKRRHELQLRLTPVLPSVSSGYLPYFLLLGGSAGAYNAVQTHLSQWQTKEIYGRAPDQGESWLVLLGRRPGWQMVIGIRSDGMEVG